MAPVESGGGLAKRFVCARVVGSSYMAAVGRRGRRVGTSGSEGGA